MPYAVTSESDYTMQLQRPWQTADHLYDRESVPEYDYVTYYTLHERAIATPQRSVSESELRQWYSALPQAVLRVNGWVQLHDQGSEPSIPALVQSVGHRLEITPTKPGAFPQEALLVLLGVSGGLHGVAAPDGSPLVPSV